MKGGVDRYPYDLSHHVMQAGKIGHLQTIGRIPVIAGDSFELNCSGLITLSPTRKPLPLDIRVDFFGFYIPHRHIYGDVWKSFIRQGVDETQTLASTSVSPSKVGTSNLGFLLYSGIPTAVPKHVIDGYSRIWYRYFSDPLHVSPEGTSGHEPPEAKFADSFASWVFDTRAAPSDLPDTPYSTSVDPREWNNIREYGLACAHLKTFATTCRDFGVDLDAGDYNVPSAAAVDVREFAQVLARYRSEQKRRYFSLRYRDVLRHFFGGDTSEDGDERPEMLFQSSQWLSGVEINGSADANVGQSVGKALGGFRFGMPRKFFGEHGTVWVLMLLRFPPIFAKEKHYLDKANPSYLEMSGEPGLIDKKPPEEIFFSDIFLGGSSTTKLGKQPYGNWLRCHPSYVHSRFVDVDAGYPFQDTPVNSKDAIYIRRDYDKLFWQTPRGQFQWLGKNEVLAIRPVRPPETSLFASLT